MNEFANRIVFGIAFIPIAILLVWLKAPWWGVSITIGLFLFLFMPTDNLAATFKGFIFAFCASVVLAIASLALAESRHTSIGALVNDYSLSKYVRRLPEYAISLLSLSVATGISALVRYLLSKRSRPDAGGT